MQFSHVYILQSKNYCERFYVGLTDNLQDRLRRHNAGEVPHTAKFMPWQIKTAVAFSDRARASDFERYLKTASGQAFARSVSDSWFGAQLRTKTATPEPAEGEGGPDAGLFQRFGPFVENLEIPVVSE